VKYAGQEYWLGPYGSAECKRRYAALLQQIRAEEAPPEPAEVRGAVPAPITVAELVLRFRDHATQHYGETSTELATFGAALKPLREMYGHLPVAEFGPLELRKWRDQQVGKRKWSRQYVNAQTRRVRHVFKWAVGHALVGPLVYQALTAVEGLSAGRTVAHENEPVGPVDDATVDATLPFLNRHIRGLIEFMRLTGCRPGEACSLRMCEVDRTGAVWLFRPKHHKTKHRGKSRTIAIGPKAQAVLAPFLGGDPAEPVFSPAAAVAELRAAQRAARKTPRYPSHIRAKAAKKKRHPKRHPAAAYSAHAVGVAVRRACALAFPPVGELAQRKGESRKAWSERLTDAQREQLAEWEAAHRWHPNQLRHSFATKVRHMPGGGLEGAQVLLGHARADVTQVYAEKNIALAVKLACEVG
jgi:integrase